MFLVALVALFVGGGMSIKNGRNAFRVWTDKIDTPSEAKAFVKYAIATVAGICVVVTAIHWLAGA